MRTFLVLSIFVLSLGFLFTQNSHAGFAQPPLWESDFGMELTDLTGCDDCIQNIDLPFDFPFAGNTYAIAGVSTNGCIHLNGEGLSGTTDYRYWEYMEEFLSDSDPDNPIICPFVSDLDLNPGGMIFYNSSNNQSVITWDGVGAYDDQEVELTFQAILYLDGRIVLNLNGILVGPGESIEDLEEGILVGVTPSDFPYDGEPMVPGDPGPNDLNGPTTSYDRTTIYERWCFDEANSCGVGGEDTDLPGPPNDEFDLDFQSICFAPRADGFEVSSAGSENPNFVCAQLVATPIPTLSEWGLIAMAGVLGIIGLIAVRRKKAAA